MGHEQSQFDEFDRLMLEASTAGRAGVFGTTPVDVESLVAQPVLSGPAHWYRHVLVGLPLAACIAMFFGVVALWENGSGTGNVLTNGSAAVSTLGGTVASPVENCRSMENFQSCLAGPGIMVPAECRCVDFDDDGDVDLRDMGVFQVNRTID